MKLIDIVIDGFQATKGVRLPQLADGLNVISSANQRHQASIPDFLSAIFFGPRATRSAVDHDGALTGPPASWPREGWSPDIWPQGHLHVQSGGQAYQLARPIVKNGGELEISDLTGRRQGYRTPDWLSRLDRSAYETFFHVCLDSHHLTQQHFVRQLAATFELDSRSTPFRDIAAFERWKLEADSRRQRLEAIQREQEPLLAERTRLQQELDRHRRESDGRLESLDAEIASLSREIEALQRHLNAQREHWDELQRHIQSLLRTIEENEQRVQHVPVVQTVVDQLAILYERLDEVDNQIRRWRSVQSDIQNERVRLRDDMTSTNSLNLDSSEHPYHHSRRILAALEEKLHRTERVAHDLTHEVDPHHGARQVAAICGEMRDDLYALCQELGQQYKHVRHKAAVAELKQLRRCFHEMEENINRLIARRDTLIEDIRKWDPAGADAIIHADLQFCQCAEHDGYLAARRKFVPQEYRPPTASPVSSPATEYRTIYPDLTAERQQLQDLERQRQTCETEIAKLESELPVLQNRLAHLRDERNRAGTHIEDEWSERLRNIENQYATLNSERTELARRVEEDRRWYDWKPNYLLSDAARFLQQLSANRWQQVWIDHQREVMVQHADGTTRQLDALSGLDENLVTLSLALAAVGQFALRGIRFPMVIQADRVLSIPEPVSSEPVDGTSATLLLNTLLAFSHSGHQVLLISSSPTLYRLAQHDQVMTYELADTEITSPPLWHPLPTSYPRGQSGTDLLREWSKPPQLETTPVLPSPPAPIAPSAPTLLSFNDPSWNAKTDERTEIERGTKLRDIDLVESIYLSSLEDLGIYTVDELLEIQLHDVPTSLLARGFQIDQLKRWQDQGWLLICLPDLACRDARVLVASGITDPETLEALTETEILERVRTYLASTAGRRSNVSLARFDAERVHRWNRWLHDRPSWREARRQRRDRDHQRSPRSSRTSNRTSNRPDAQPRTPRSSRSSERSTPQTTPEHTGPLFYLNLSDDIEAGPSIGPKTAERFYAIGVTTVEDFLNQDAESMAKQLSNRRMSAKVIRNWQKQSRLMCSVPKLRGHDSQILVALDMDDRDKLRNVSPEELWSKVEPFIDTKEGQRIIRNGKRPDLDEIREWIEAASEGRDLQAA